MSLINDALKRAKESQRSDTPAGAPPMRPVEAKRTERDFSLILPVLIVFLIITAFIFIGLAMTRHAAKPPVKQIVAAPAVVPTQEVATAIAPMLAPPIAAPASSAPPVTAPPAEVTSPSAVKTETPKPIRVQGIAYDPVLSWAIVNDKTVYNDDFVDGMRVTAISRNSVTLVGNGRTNTLVVVQH